jgi:hypothetical protein
MYFLCSLKQELAYEISNTVIELDFGLRNVRKRCKLVVEANQTRKVRISQQLPTNYHVTFWVNTFSIMDLINQATAPIFIFSKQPFLSNEFHDRLNRFYLTRMRHIINSVEVYILWNEQSHPFYRTNLFAAIFRSVFPHIITVPMLSGYNRICTWYKIV